ncbi:arsenate reductase (azurin) large subunit [Acidiphilium sp. PM]|uniref:arsenate reductase (azurin) large subunit n=1 Tax=Acidiphilium sp. PM TaxID=1043206 RepID=UPI0002EF4492|nr:arsenate reductase (azurin) large subunit [Acidiphilium sp. PM]
MALYRREESVPLPPKNAEAYNTVCQYCTVGCGYKVYVWPDGLAGGLKAGDNAFDVDFTSPQPPIAGFSYTESMHSTIQRRDGGTYHVAIVPAHDSPINLQGNHSSRGAINAKTTWSDSRPTQARLHYPLLRVGDMFNVIPWDAAIELQARVLKGVMDKYGADDLCAKIYDHGGGGGGMENTYGTGRLLFTGLQMKHTGIHNRPAYSAETYGTRDRGLFELNYCYEDARLADTIMLWGANTYDTATVFFVAHMMPNLQGTTIDEKKKHYAKGEPVAAARMVIVDPRISSTVSAARKTGAKVLHLRPNLGADYMLMNAVARAVWEKKYYNKDFLNRHTDMATFEDYKKKSLELQMPYKDFMARAQKITGVPVAQIEQAAAWIAQPKPGGHWRRSLILYEKGVIWNYRQYDAVAAIAQLGALTFNIGRPGTGTGRQGGHQEGYARPPYPGLRPPPDVDKYVQEGKGKTFWLIGCNPYLAAQNNAWFRKRIGERAQALTDFLSAQKQGDGEPASIQALADRILDGLEKTGGLFLTVQNIYMVESTRDAHLILPAAQWGEAENISLNCGDRLMRLDDRFMDPPGDAKPDWEIHGLVGQKLEALYKADGKADIAKRFSGMDWKHGADVVKSIQEDLYVGMNTKVPASEASKLDPESFKGVDYVYLRKIGQKGIQTPVRMDPNTGELVGTKRLYPTWNFMTKDGKFSWYGARPWDDYAEAKIVAGYLKSDRSKYPFWFTMGRSQPLWQTSYHMRLLAQKTEGTPLPFVQVNPADAKKLGVSDGDIVMIYNDQGNETFAVYETDAVPPGMVFALMYHWLGTSNSLTSPYTDPMSTNPWYKGTRVGIRKLAGGMPSIVATTSFRPTNTFV